MREFETHILEYSGKIEGTPVSSVYQACDPRTSRQYLIARVLPDGGVSDQSRNITLMFEDLNLLFQHPHQGIGKVVNYGYDEDGPYYMRNYFNRSISRKSFGSEVFNGEQFCSIAYSVLSGLGHAHDLGVYHRRIDPDAISLIETQSKKPTAFLMRFGLRHIWSRNTFLNAEEDLGNEVGNIYFAAPELLRGEAGDHRADLYSLGCVFFYLLARYYPVQQRSYSQVIDSHLAGRVIPLSKGRPDLPSFLSRWMERLVAVDPEERHQSAWEAIEALEIAVKEYRASKGEGKSF